jgi:hypothetical protein
MYASIKTYILLLSYRVLGMKGLKMGPVGKNDSDGTDAQEDKMASNVICKCEKVTGTLLFLVVLATLRQTLIHVHSPFSQSWRL